MARIRDIKPEIWTDEDFGGELSPWAMLAFIGLWNHVDRNGVVEYRPTRLRVLVFPYRPEIDMDALLQELAQPRKHSKGGFIRRYEAGGRRWLQVRNFGRHQKFDTREKPTGNPLPPPESDEHPTDTPLGGEQHPTDTPPGGEQHTTNTRLVGDESGVSRLRERGVGNGERETDRDTNGDGNGTGAGPPPPPLTADPPDYTPVEVLRCPDCQRVAVVRQQSHLGPGWACSRPRGGCNTVFDPGEPEILVQLPEQQIVAVQRSLARRAAWAGGGPAPPPAAAVALALERRRRVVAGLVQAAEPAGELWPQVLAHVRDQVNPHSYATWFRPLEGADLGLVRDDEGPRLLVVVPSEQFRDWLGGNYRHVIDAGLMAAGRPEVSPMLVLPDELPDRGPPAATIKQPSSFTRENGEKGGPETAGTR